MKKLLFISCLAITSSSFAGISNFLAWNKSEINVCFAGKGTEVKTGKIPNGFANWSERQKDYIKDVLEREFTPERTGYSFVGFNDCDPAAKPDVIIVRKGNLSPQALKYKGLATIGRGPFAPSSTYRSARGFVLFTASGIRNHATIVHEFGHILGLRHEHEHPDAKDQAQSWCKHYTENTQRYNYNMYTPFDESSVMNYCTALKDSKAGLSRGDVEHIQALYKYSKERYNW